MAITRQDGRVEFEGAVLSGVFTGNRWLMSDYGLAVYCTVWTGASVRNEQVGITAIGPGADYQDRVEVDATPETLAAVAAWREREAAAEAELRKAEAAAARQREFERVDVGRAVVVVRGRKVAIGTKGVVRWMGDNRFGRSVGIAVEGVEGLVFTSFGNVERDLSAAASEIDAAHDAALWFEANVYAAKRALKATGVAKGDRVTPTAGVYAGRACRVIWTGTRDGQARVGVVPVPPAGRRRSSEPADWLNVAAVAAAA